MTNDSATKRPTRSTSARASTWSWPAGVHVTVLVPVLVNTPVIARIGLDKMGLPAKAISPEQSVDEALTSLQDNQATTLTRADMSEAFQGMKAAVAKMIQARLAASRPAR